MKVPVTITETTLRNDRGLMIPGVVADCSRCKHQTQSFGTSDKSLKRCLALLRDECPNDENNYYHDDDD